MESTGAARRHDLLLTRLRAGRPHAFQVHPGADGAPRDGTFETAPLPRAVAALSFDTEGTPTHPLALLDVQHTEGFGGLVVVDASGEVVWYLEVPGGVLGSTRRANGRLAFIARATGVVEVGIDGTVVGTLPNDAGRHAHHDLVEHDGALLILAQDPRPWNDTVVAGEAVWRWDGPGAAPTRIWSTWDRLDPAVDRGAASRPGDWFHANSVSVGPRGNLVVSLHFLDQVVSVDPTDGTFEWRFGGVNASIPAPADEVFTGQHTAAEIAPNRVLLFDNGRDRTEARYSRAVVFQLDPAAGSAEKVREFRPTPDNWARALSLARPLPGGGLFVHFGGNTGPVETYEVRADGTVAWRMTTRGLASLYRVAPLASLAGEEVEGASSGGRRFSALRAGRQPPTGAAWRAGSSMRRRTSP